MIVLTAHADELDRVRVFERGGDDVVSKPFSDPELRGRIRVLLRRAHESSAAGQIPLRRSLDKVVACTVPGR